MIHGFVVMACREEGLHCNVYIIPCGSQREFRRYAEDNSPPDYREHRMKGREVREPEQTWPLVTLPATHYKPMLLVE
jgi:hypothetical protein